MRWLRSMIFAGLASSAGLGRLERVEQRAGLRHAVAVRAQIARRAAMASLFRRLKQGRNA